MPRPARPVARRAGAFALSVAPVVVKPDAVPQFVAIRAASLDDPGWFNPQADVWISDAHAWDQMNPGLPKFEKYPPP
ncbi:MAG TPA: hypothetical protein VG796_28535 [Verrucomicrobiales bacterium]|nr:hypothetical protein [Verrucomicrobiales bacterium]